ncbi:Ig-like domain-containing protein [Litoribaculum gwangyangense]|uniref:SbsA Ig-like domain-containing protein n=1 Tax=Litoribaculum gwangyangense TaxID=1130722 RepID=A0ABP9BW89_9FLAO
MKIIKKISVYMLIPMVFLTIFLVGCDKDDDGSIVDNTLIVMVKTINDIKFDNGIENVNVNASIEIIFSHTLNTELFTSSLKLNSDSGNVDYSLIFSNTNSTITLTPNTPLAYESRYTLTLPAGDYGLAGESFKEALSLSFTTAPFVPPVLSLSSDKLELEENSDTATITISLDKASQDDVTATIEISGTATDTEDYNISGSLNISIPAGSTSTSILLTSILDSENEGDETIILSLTNVVNANNSSQNLTIILKEQLPAISLKGVMALTWDGSGTNDGKAIHLIANQDIADLSVYGLGVANNGGGTDGLEYSFPVQSVSAGDDILVAREPALLSTYFGDCANEFEHIFQANTSISQNGDDAIELFSETTVIETYGDADVDGTGEVWEYTGSWAYKFDGVWTYGGIDCSIGSTTTQSSSCVYPICAQPLILQGVMAILWDGSGVNGGKAVHLKAQKNIADLSIYSIGVANNGGGTDGIEFTFPAISVSEGEDILLARETATIASYFGACINTFEHIIESGSMNQNGDDAIELFEGNDVIETYGDANVDGTGQSWEYAGSWAYKLNGNWITGGVDCAAGSTSTQSSSCAYPQCD